MLSGLQIFDSQSWKGPRRPCEAPGSLTCAPLVLAYPCCGLSGSLEEDSQHGYADQPQKTPESVSQVSCETGDLGHH